MAELIELKLMAYFQAHGLEAEPIDALNQALVDAIGTMRLSTYATTKDELPDLEKDILIKGGFDLEHHPHAPPLRDPFTEMALAYAALISTSLNTQAVAERLGRNPSRIRQMLAERSLYGFQVDGEWHIPEFQFADGALVPNISRVVHALDPAMNPVAVYRWFTLPEPDLEYNSNAVTPLQWLLSGGDVERAVAAAADV